jgi:hypothetical protein
MVHAVERFIGWVIIQTFTNFYSKSLWRAFEKIGIIVKKDNGS